MACELYEHLRNGFAGRRGYINWFYITLHYKSGVQLFHGVAAIPQHLFVSYEASLCVQINFNLISSKIQ